jgi:polar amino acid transport system substrate-binding protein
MRNELPGLLHGINEGARRIKRIVQNLKDFARQEPGEITQLLQVRTVIDAATVILGNLIKNATNKFEVIEEGTIPSIKGNFQRLEQVIINLITNACQAIKNKDDPITVTISHDRVKHLVIVSIDDRGHGIPPENLKYIMDPFFTTKRDKGGTGLGLAISYSIIKDHGGDLRIESALGKGTKAMVILPVYEKDLA